MHRLITTNSKTIKLIRILTILATIIATIGICEKTFYMVVVYAQPPFYGTSFQLVMRNVFRTLYAISLLATLLIATLRIRVTLNATSYQYSAIVYIVFWALFSVGVIVGFLCMIGELFLKYNVTISLGIVGIIIYVFLIFYAITLFIRVLKNIAINLDGKAQSKHRAQLFKVITKYAILVIVPSLVTLLSGLTAIPYGMGYVFRQQIWIDLLYFPTIVMDLLVNIISLGLQFEFDEEKYFKICAMCHDKIVNIFIKAESSSDLRDPTVVITQIVGSPKRKVHIGDKIELME